MLAPALADSPHSAPALQAGGAGGPAPHPCLGTPRSAPPLLHSGWRPVGAAVPPAVGLGASRQPQGGLQESSVTPPSVPTRCPSTSWPGVQSRPHGPLLQPPCAPLQPHCAEQPRAQPVLGEPVPGRAPEACLSHQGKSAGLKAAHRPGRHPRLSPRTDSGCPQPGAWEGGSGRRRGGTEPWLLAGRSILVPEALVWPSLGDPYSWGVNTKLKADCTGGS